MVVNHVELHCENLLGFYSENSNQVLANILKDLNGMKAPRVWGAELQLAAGSRAFRKLTSVLAFKDI